MHEHSNRLIILLACGNVHSARSACKQRNEETKMRGGCYLEQKTLGRLAGSGEVTVVLLQRQTVVAASGCFFFFLLPSAFSAPLMCLLCSSLFNLWRWRFCRWWLGGTVEALVEVQRWLFSSLFCLALSLSFPSLSVLLFFFF